MREDKLITSFDEIPREVLFGGKVLRRVFLTKNIEIVEYVYKGGAHFPEHSHREEQITIIESGTLNFYLDGELITLKKGDICYVPPYKPHSAKVPGEAEVRTINIFHPSRKERP